ncbi:MAG: exodeoxyribonuclease VII small subunit [Prevotellaceae bacterium]|jgi:exodeoxyribonuclease VII small subunit|nr:exodeoxyribonuclease VII small subunit [Prevotellaceae bacterium]
MSTKEISYQSALAEVEKIIAQLENNELDVDSMAEAVKRAAELLKLCRQRLCEADEAIEKALAE